MDPTPRQTLAVILGASSFRRAPKLAPGRAFYNSAEDFREYLLASDGLGLPLENIDWLFDDSRSPTDQLQDIGAFLESRSAYLTSMGTPPQDLIAYYAGHGLFAGADNAYCLAIRETDARSEELTSIRVSDLAAIFKAYARFLRKFLILDCCFSAAAYKEFQSGPLQVGRAKLLEELPQRGTALLCSASSQDPSLAPEGLSRTMFSDSLLRALQRGSPSLEPMLSLSELGDLVKVNLKEAYPDTWVRPEVHSPDQREGNVADVRLFPNMFSRIPKAEWARQAVQAEMTRPDAEARGGAEAERERHAEAERERQKETVKALQPNEAGATRLQVEDSERSRAMPLRRVGADVVDYLVMSALFTIVMWLERSLFEFIGSFTVILLTGSLFIHKTGCTLGHRLMGTRIVDSRGNSLTYCRALVYATMWFVWCMWWWSAIITMMLNRGA